MHLAAFFRQPYESPFVKHHTEDSQNAGHTTSNETLFKLIVRIRSDRKYEKQNESSGPYEPRSPKP